MAQLSIVQQISLFVPQLLLIAAILLSLWSLLIARRNLKINVIPTIVFSCGPQGWIAENVGNGPALNLILYNGPGEHFERAVRCYAMAKGSERTIPWVSQPGQLGATYEDVHGRRFTSLCKHDETRITRGKDLIKRPGKIERERVLRQSLLNQSPANATDIYSLLDDASSGDSRLQTSPLCPPPQEQRVGMGRRSVDRLRHHEMIEHEDRAMQIYVTNLTYTTTEDELSHLFEPYGIVESVRIITDRDTGRSRGFGFVEMPNTAEAQAAIDGLNGTSLGGRTLTVNEARPREERDGARREPRRPRW